MLVNVSQPSPDKKLIVHPPSEGEQVGALIMLCSVRLLGFHLRKFSFKYHVTCPNWSLWNMYAIYGKS